MHMFMFSQIVYVHHMSFCKYAFQLHFRTVEAFVYTFSIVTYEVHLSDSLTASDDAIDVKSFFST